MSVFRYRSRTAKLRYTGIRGVHMAPKTLGLLLVVVLAFTLPSLHRAKQSQLVTARLAPNDADRPQGTPRLHVALVVAFDTDRRKAIFNRRSQIADGQQGIVAGRSVSRPFSNHGTSDVSKHCTRRP